MNVERWIRARNDSWQRLEKLLARIGKAGLSNLRRQELQELGLLYRTVSSDLSRARAMKVGTEMELYLNNLVINAHNQVYQTRINKAPQLLDFLKVGFPQLVRHYFIYVCAAFCIFIIPFMVSYSYAKSDPYFGQMDLVPGHSMVPEDLWPLIERKQMWTDSTEKFSGAMASLIYTNNIKVALMSFALGITFGVGTVFVLIQNGLVNGALLGVCQANDMSGKLLTFTAAHGVLELFAIFVSGGAGLVLARAMLFPGQYKRLDALRLVAKDASCLFAGTIPLLLVAGIIEGFISPRTDLSQANKVLMTAATSLSLLFYVLVPGRNSKTRA